MFAEMHADLRRIRRERVETTAAAAADTSTARNVTPRDHYHDAYAYDDVPMDRNPCAADASSVHGGFLRTALRGASFVRRRFLSVAVWRTARLTCP